MATKSSPHAPRAAAPAAAVQPLLRPVPPRQRVGGDLVGLALITAGFLLLVGLRTSQAGPVVRFVADSSALLLGRLVDAVPFALFFLGVRWLWRQDYRHPNRGVLPGLALLGLVAAGFLHQRVPGGEEFLSSANGLGWLHPPEQYGGLLGGGLVWMLRHCFGGLGCPIVLTMLAVGALLLLSESTVRDLLAGAHDSALAAQGRHRERRAARAEQAAAQAAGQQHAATAPRAELAPTGARPRRGARLQVADLTFPDTSDAAFLPPLEAIAPTDEPVAAVPSVAPEPSSRRRGRRPAEPSLDPPVDPEPEVAAVAAPVTADAPAEAAPADPLVLPPHVSKLNWPAFDALKRDPVVAIEDAPWSQLVLPGMPEPHRRRGHATSPDEFPAPALNLIEPPPSPPLPDRSPEIQANSRRLESTFDSFGVNATVVNTEIGPTITRYEMELGPGIRVSRVAGMADDIMLALAAAGVRIEAPVPGKGVIGIEVPNQIRETVDLHALLSSPVFQQAKGDLPIIIGKDIAGHIQVGDLARMPHLLVAGTTNSGKSVCLNCIVISLMYRLCPRDLRFLMIDPKRVELTLYDGIPHLDRPVVTEVEDAADLLRGAVREMYARYDRMNAAEVRNIASYNAKCAPEERMPYIVVIIDELAELMMMARGEVEPSIVRLAQLARAVGIHLVLATQRPAVNVVTGQIKANIPSRIAFRVPALVDSRVILDDKGAERLIGRGDMLFCTEETGGLPSRLQGAFVGEAQVHKLVNWLRNLPSTLLVRYKESIIQPVQADDGDSPADGPVDDSELDELFWQCVQLVRSESEASTSRLQRTFGIGYNRAGRIMDQMHALGIVGPPRGSKPREVLSGGPLAPGERRPSAPAAVGGEDLDEV